MDVEDLFNAIQEACLPGLWSKGVAFARGGSVIEDKITDEEIIVRVHAKDRPVSPKVQLWPRDEDWFCDCGDRNDVCAHVAAAVIAAKQGQIQGKQNSENAQTDGAPILRYRFFRVEGRLSLSRVLIQGQNEEVLTESLVSLMGGLSSGRLSDRFKGRLIAATKEDFGADHILLGQRRRTLDPDALLRLLTVLQDNSNLEFEGKPIRTSPHAPGARGELVDSEPGDGAGFKLVIRKDAEPDEVFGNGVVLCGDVLRPKGASFQIEGRSFSPNQAYELVTEILPELRRKISVEVRTTRLPVLKEVAPRVVIRMESQGEQTLCVVPELVYGNPPIARLGETQFEYLSSKEVPLRDQNAERNLIRKLQGELQLKPGQLVRLEGLSAIEFAGKLKNWEVSGGATESFTVGGELQVRFDVLGEGFAVGFGSGSGEGGSADSARVFQAWKSGLDYVPLLGGGFAKLPLDWLNKFGSRIQSLLAARDASGRLPQYLLPELAQVCELSGVDCPESLRKLKVALEKFEGIKAASLPVDLKANLRDYQKKGIDWLCFLRDSNLGAMLADDMGLGKTLQALCAIRGRTLIVCPTSVLYSWAGQIEQFRPGLKYSIYHGPGRKFDSRADLLLTSYAIMRLDREQLLSVEWDTAILDEAQTIKNPDSQVARAAHEIRAKFKIALTGTPIENRIEDLWSQFQFLNPGLLGERNDLQDKEIRRKVRPFVLRRLKREVAPELPPRTEVVLNSDLTDEEKESYQALYAITKKEVLNELETNSGRGVIRALELLLRLRQACCHLSLLPGQKAKTSSKVELLVETLTESIELGHRALIFSQWTSYLDLIEPELARAGIRFTRLDGTTPNRQRVVDEFQSENGPEVMLISLKAGGVGLTLTRADHIFLMDPWWNPAVEDQAADRAHRIGQKNPVLIHKLVARDTIEERIIELQRRKRELANSILDDGTAAASLTKDDLLELLR